MDWEDIQNNWRMHAANIRRRWQDLTDDDIAMVDGQRERLTDKLLQRYGYARERANSELREFAREQAEEPARSNEDE